jgi:ribose 5-phosphate isomerase B
MIYLGADHKGFHLKEALKKYLKELEFDYIDMGNQQYNQEDDFPDFGKSVARKIAEVPDKNMGVLICGSGVGMDIVANRQTGVRSVLAFSPEHAQASKKEDNTNILSLAADFLTEEQAKNILLAWLEADFDKAPKRIRRLEKIEEV